MSDEERPKMVYGVRVSNDYEGAGSVEAVFTSEVVACEHARHRSTERYRNSGNVTRWELDNPSEGVWVAIYRDGRCQYSNTTARR